MALAHTSHLMRALAAGSLIAVVLLFVFVLVCTFLVVVVTQAVLLVADRYDRRDDPHQVCLVFKYYRCDECYSILTLLAECICLLPLLQYVHFWLLNLMLGIGQR